MSRGRRTSERTGSAGAIAFTALLLAVALGFLVGTVGLPSSAALVPRAVAVPLALLLAYRLVREILARTRRGVESPGPEPGPRAGEGPEARTGDAPEPPDGRTPGEEDERTPDELGAILWLLALPAVSTLLGFVAGPALYATAWARFRVGERPAVALAAGIVTAAAILLVFAGLLGARLPQGVVGAFL